MSYFKGVGKAEIVCCVIFQGGRKGRNCLLCHIPRGEAEIVCCAIFQGGRGGRNCFVSYSKGEGEAEIV